MILSEEEEREEKEGQYKDQKKEEEEREEKVYKIDIVNEITYWDDDVFVDRNRSEAKERYTR